MAEKSILFDTTKCMGCRACQVACKQWWGLPGVSTTNRGTYENPSDLTAETWNKIRFKEVVWNGAVRWLFTRQACMHCTDAVCVWVCPTYARSYNELGYVTIDQERCIGCGRCLAYCPFEVPRVGRANISPRLTVQLEPNRGLAYKCEFCSDRLAEGLTPACVKTCPPGALQFGDRSELIGIGQAKVSAIKTGFPQARLYGQNELGGLHVMYVLTDAPGVHGLPEAPKFGTYPKFDEKGYPEWYVQALTAGSLPAFPPDARQEWYLQPTYAPPGRPAEQELPLTPVVPGVSWLSRSLIGLGTVGVGVAAWWVLRRRMSLQKEKEST